MNRTPCNNKKKPRPPSTRKNALKVMKKDRVGNFDPRCTRQSECEAFHRTRTATEGRGASSEQPHSPQCSSGPLMLPRSRHVEWGRDILSDRKRLHPFLIFTSSFPLTIFYSPITSERFSSSSATCLEADIFRGNRGRIVV